MVFILPESFSKPGGGEHPANNSVTEFHLTPKGLPDLKLGPQKSKRQRHLYFL
jgi:hypothetical protein